MSQPNRDSGKSWSNQDKRNLKRLANQNTRTATAFCLALPKTLLASSDGSVVNACVVKKGKDGTSIIIPKNEDEDARRTRAAPCLCLSRSFWNWSSSHPHT